jgi:hypothetical protein
MRSIARFVSSAALILTVGTASPAWADVTPQDLVKLHVAGLSDDILVALIESDGATFKLTADEIIALRNQGLSERVLRAMLYAGKPMPAQVAARDRVPATPAPVAEPAPVVAAPVVTVTQHVEQVVEQPRTETQTVYVPVHVAVPVAVRPAAPPKKAPEPVYWGFGGQRRPDTWRDR